MNVSFSSESLGFSLVKPTLLIFLFIFLTACTVSGPLKIFERTYIAVPSGENTNYYRISVSATTHFNDAEYESAWFPAYAIDGIYGYTNTEEDKNRLETQRQIQESLNEAILDTQKSYLTVAKDPNKSAEEIQKYIVAQRRVRAIAGSDTPLPKGTVEFEYDPSRNLVLRHAGQKRIFTLTANPDNVLNAIKSKVETMETSVKISRLFEAIREGQRKRNLEFSAEFEISRKADKAVAEQLNALLTSLDSGSQTDRNELLSEVDALLMMVEAIQ